MDTATLYWIAQTEAKKRNRKGGLNVFKERGKHIVTDTALCDSLGSIEEWTHTANGCKH